MLFLAALMSRWPRGSDRAEQARAQPASDRGTRLEGESDVADAGAPAPGWLAPRVAKRPHLAPRDSSAEAFEDWLLAQGVDIVDVEEAALMHLDICEAMGWPAPTDDPEPVAPREALAAPMPTRVQLEARAAAERFVEWLRFEGHTGAIGAKHLGDLYRRHCEVEDLIELAERTLKSGMIAIGIERAVDKQKVQGRRYRPTVWLIPAVETVHDLVPWPDMPAADAPLPKRAA